MWQGHMTLIDGLMQERCTSIANALELHLSCTHPSRWENSSAMKSSPKYYAELYSTWTMKIWWNILLILYINHVDMSVTAAWYLYINTQEQRACGLNPTSAGAVCIQNPSYRKTPSISHTKSQNLNVSCILLQLSSFNPLKPGVKLRMKM